MKEKNPEHRVTQINDQKKLRMNRGWGGTTPSFLLNTHTGLIYDKEYRDWRQFFFPSMSCFLVFIILLSKLFPLGPSGW